MAENQQNEEIAPMGEEKSCITSFFGESKSKDEVGVC
jgi:hypothetical protein